MERLAIGRRTIGRSPQRHIATRPSAGPVRSWPYSEAAREALAAYVERRAEDENATLTGAHLDFRGADLRGMDLSRADFTEATLDGVSFAGCTLNRADFTDSSIVGATFVNVEMIGADLFQVSGRGACFADAWLSGTEAEFADLRAGDFRNAFLGGVSFVKSDLTGADLRHAKAERTLFIGCRVADMRLTGFSGSIVGPSVAGNDTELHDGLLQGWFQERDADVTVVSV
ncbi:pentapeptide repeat-containing protein [Actinoallomurus spadix]|uniref:Pentapeptide repeat-containing protein n=1 Tax=Actinoallomurus spadix TaxID=79912 RepID=A0ABP3GAG4_9ACTN|nr:pentapeptide repeat-containing protein [Actinoallomurus spadix]MCO5989923.1 pentapeptide repeat-containing protein [Actinoallomurus spadix]